MSVERSSLELCRWQITLYKSIGKQEMTISLAGKPTKSLLYPLQIQNSSPVNDQCLKQWTVPAAVTLSRAGGGFKPATNAFGPIGGGLKHAKDETDNW